MNELYISYPKIPKRDINSIVLHVLGIHDYSSLVFIEDISYQKMQELQTCITPYCNGMPLEYITGTCNFYGMNFDINQSVLIPRVDTEILVTETINEISNNHLIVADLCSGSGCVALAIAKHCPNAKFFCYEISGNSIEVNKRNIDIHNAADRICVHQMDLLVHLPNKQFSVVVSNPPYVESGVIQTLNKSVSEFEPHIALDGGSDGLIFYKRFVEFAQQTQECTFIFEIGYNQKDSILDLIANQIPSANVQTIYDTGQNPRVIKFRV